MLSREQTPLMLWNGRPLERSGAPVNGVSLSTALAEIFHREGIEVASILLVGKGLGVTDIAAEVNPTYPEVCAKCRWCLSYLEIVGKLQRFLFTQGEHSFVEIVLRDGLPWLEPTEGWLRQGIFDQPDTGENIETFSH